MAMLAGGPYQAAVARVPGVGMAPGNPWAVRRGGAAATKGGEAGCCAMGAKMGRGDGGTGVTGGATVNSSVDRAGEAGDRGREAEVGAKTRGVTALMCGIAGEAVDGFSAVDGASEAMDGVMITMDFGISPGCYQVEGVKTLNYSGNSVVK